MIDILGAAHPNYKGNKVTENIIVGLSGYARTGKDTVADVLVQEFGFKRYAFADKLRECVLALDPIVSTGHERLKDFESKYRRLSSVIEEFGWDGYKQSNYGSEIRSLLQRMGTEVGRDIIGEDTWVKGLDNESGRIVVTDMRFPNEYDRVVNNNGETWRITREGVTAVNAHISETAIDDKKFDVDILNHGTLEEFQGVIRTLAQVRGW